MKKRLFILLTVCCLLTAFSMPAAATDYHFPAPDAELFAEPTSDNTIYVTTGEAVNTDRSKTAAVIPPAFGSPMSYTLNAGEPLTPNLTAAWTQGAAVNASGGVALLPPSVLPGAANPFTVSYSGYTAPAYTAVTSDLYYSGGNLGTLKIPAIGLTVNVYQGTDSATLAKGAGHFTETSIWDGNVAIAAHNRGVNNHFGKIHTLNVGDTISYTTRLGTRSYEVYSVSKISVDDGSVLDSSRENIITLITCVMDQPSYRWCVRANAK